MIVDREVLGNSPPSYNRAASCRDSLVDRGNRCSPPQADFYVVVRGDSMASVDYRTEDIIAIKRTRTRPRAMS